MKLLTAGIIILLALVLLSATTGADDRPDEDILWFFWGDGCALCEDAKEWLEEISEKYPEVVIKKLEVWKDEENRELYLDMLDKAGEKGSWVPAFILDERVRFGFNETVTTQIEKTIKNIYYPGVYGDEDFTPREKEKETAGGQFDVKIPFSGILDLSAMPLSVSTGLIALIDGLNPCSLWVITLLLSMIISAGSRKRVAAVGFVFLAGSAAVYGLFIAGVFSVVSVASRISSLRFFLAIPVLVFAVVNIKDYFAFGKFFSFTIPDRFKPVVYKYSNKIRNRKYILPALAVTLLFSVSASLIELPCTFGFPLVWTGLITQAGVGTTGFLSLLGLYLAIYFLIEVCIITTALVSMKVFEIDKSRAGILKLFSGFMMASFGLFLVVNPGGIGDILAPVYIMGAALAGCIAVAVTRRIYEKKRS